MGDGQLLKVDNGWGKLSQKNDGCCISDLNLSHGWSYDQSSKICCLMNLINLIHSRTSTCHRNGPVALGRCARNWLA